MRKGKLGFAAPLAIVGALFAWQASATMIDLTNDPKQDCADLNDGASVCGVTVAGGENVGTGVFPSFVKSNTNDDSYHMYNTNGTLDADNQVTNSGEFNRVISLGDLAVENIDGVDYFILALDINQNSGSGEPPPNWLSIDDIKLYTSSSNALNHYDSGTGQLGGVDPFWAMTDEDWIKLDYDLGSGSGSTIDMYLYIPVSLLGGAPETNYLYLFNANGAEFANNDGAEEWAYKSCVDSKGAPIEGTTCYSPPHDEVPEPATLALLGVGLFGLGFARRRKH